MGKEILRARYKLYLADPAITPAILMKGKTIIEDPKALSNFVETAVFSRLKAHSTSKHSRFCYWKDPKDKELDLIVETADTLIPIEVKYQFQQTTTDGIHGLINFCRQKEDIKYGYVITKTSQDVGQLKINHRTTTQIMRIPAPLFCYWLGESEIEQKSILCS